MSRIYLDYNASTPVDPTVAHAMRAVLEDHYGNPSSGHWAAQSAKALLEQSRAQVASLLGCTPGELVFTSGGSEANNLAIKGLYFVVGHHRARIITSAIEHPSILEQCRFLERLGACITRLPVDGAGRVDPDDLRRAITSDTILISIMHANNEVGTVQPIAACARIAHEHGIPFHTDAAQSTGKIPTRVDELGVDLLSIAGYKIYAPKGVGALYVRAGLKLESLIHGGAHESGRRAGTESVLLATGLGAASVLAQDRAWTQQVLELRERLWAALQERFAGRVVLNGHPEDRLPNTLNASFLDRSGPELLAALEGIAASTGSACHSGQVELSHVLRAMQVPESIGAGAIRFSLGRTTTRGEIESAIERIGSAFRRA